MILFYFQHSASLLFFYTDPGSGQLIIQLLAATFLGGLFYVRRLKDWIMRRSNNHAEEGVTAPQPVSETGTK